MQDVTSSVISKFVSEIGEMLNQLSKLEKIKVELEEEVYQLKCAEEKSHVVKTSLEEQLTRYNAEKELLSEKLEHEINERKRVEEEFHAVKASLEEQLAKRKSEIDVLMNNAENEREVFKEGLDYLQQQVNTWLNRSFEGRK